MVKTITINGGSKVNVNVGDVIFVSLVPNKNNYLVRGKFVDSKDGIVTFSILNPKLELEDIPILESRVIKIEKPN